MTHLIMGYKNFAASKGISHIGLGVSGFNTVSVLSRHGIDATSVPLVTPDDLYTYLEKHYEVSHVVVSAPWIPAKTYRHLCRRFPNIIFTVLVHSNVGFLQADPRGVRNIREIAEMQPHFKNMRLAGNCEEFVAWVKDSYGLPCWLLPNLYNLGNIQTIPIKHQWRGGILRVGSFGAVRPLKNTISAAGAALQLSHQLKTPVEFWMSANRVEGGAGCVLNAIEEMLAGTHVKIVHSPWQPWPEFRSTVAKIHLHLQPSYTESFNITVADAVAVGVPSVVSPAIWWTPKSWHADADDVGDMVRVGKQLIKDPHAVKDGFLALQNYIKHGLHHWEKFVEKKRYVTH